MKLFTCTCGQTIFFDSDRCTNCKRALLFLPEFHVLSALDPHDDDVLVALHPDAKGLLYRRCKNAVDYEACTWGIAVADSGVEGLCVSCRLNSVIPEVSNPVAKRQWQRLETGKRRMLYTIMDLRLPLENRYVRPENGLSFAFLEDKVGERVLTGQENGLITINLSEADHANREKMREQLGELYRTVLGHFRHEVGHYYWDRLVLHSTDLEQCRALFGDERLDYQEALAKHYKNGPPSDWPEHFISSYATMHPWEDWAETWAHYLHMVDTLQTARSYSLTIALQPEGAAAQPTVAMTAVDFSTFDSLVESWVPLGLALNSLDRSMGQADSYPFVLSAPALVKLRFVHDVIVKNRQTTLQKYPVATPPAKVPGASAHA